MKTQSRFIFPMACLLALSGCFSKAPPQPLKPDYQRGARVFDVYCAECHRNAKSEAPQLDDGEDWDVRTHEWEAILRDHIKGGFLNMPAKGGHPELTDQNIRDVLYFIEIKLKAQD